MGHYEALGVPRDADRDRIRAAYVSRARMAHPDVNRDGTPDERSRATRRMSELNEAWRVLGDPARRAVYDRSLRRAASRGRAGEPPIAPRPRSATPAPEPAPGRVPGASPVGGRSNPIALVPVLLLACALFLLTVGLVVGGPVLAAGGVLFALAVLAFVVSPLVALAASGRDRSTVRG